MMTFIAENIWTIVEIYVIGAAVVFVGVLLFFFYICRAEDKERKLYPDDCFYQENAAGTFATMCIGIIVAIGCAILWWAIPILIIALICMYAVSKRFPNIMGNMTDDEETEE